MLIDAHWNQRGMDAIRATFDVDAATKRQIIEFLFAEGFWNKETLSWDAAVARYNDCLNPLKPAFFKIAEAWAVMLRFERHELFFAMARDLGFEIRRIPTEERRQALLERIAIATESYTVAVAASNAELARLATEPAAQRHTPGQPVRFSLESDTPPPGGF